MAICRGPGGPRHFHRVAVGMTRISGFAVAVTLVALAPLASCSSQSPKTPSASASAAATGTATAFNRLGYRFVVPTDWVAQEGYMDWDTWDGPPHKGTPPFDTFMSQASDPWIVVGKRQVHDSASLDQWIEQLRSDHLITYEPGECGAVEDQRATTLGGEPAEMLGFHCPVDGPDAVAAQVLTRHGDTGWVVMCFSEKGRAGTLPEHQQQCERWLSTFQFLP
jgi:hypothetical protein